MFDYTVALLKSPACGRFQSSHMPVSPVLSSVGSREWDLALLGLEFARNASCPVLSRWLSSGLFLLSVRA